MLERLCKLNRLDILQSKIIDRITKDIWTSKIDISGEFMENSACWNILTHEKLNFNEDFEFKYRFYLPHNGSRPVRPHLLTFRVWSESI